ncbi:MAG: hypothetical protein AABZ15_07095 [Nitrospirota bacterium]
MNSGRLNIIVGGIVLILAGLGGFALGFTMDAYFEKGFYALPLGMLLLKAGHTHGMPLSLYNILVGSLVDRLALTAKGKRACSFAALGSFIMPFGLILRGATDGAMTFAPVVLIGALCLLISAAIMVKGAIALKSA